jgi:hypothetical protein
MESGCIIEDGNNRGNRIVTPRHPVIARMADNP